MSGPGKHLVIDARAAMPALDGLGMHLRQLVPRIVASGSFRVTLLVHPEMVGHWTHAAPQARCLPSDCRPMWLEQNWAIPHLLRGLSPDLFYYPAHDPPLFVSCPFVFTIHDLTPHQISPYFESHDTLKRRYLRLVTARGLRRAAAVFTVSAATRDAALALFPQARRARIVVTRNGIVAPLAAPRVTRDILLYVGTDRPHKNIDRLLQGYAAASHGSPEVPPLHMAGGFRRQEYYARMIADLGIQARVTLHGHVSDPVLEGLFARARALLMPSLSEGFGIPIADAMAREVPVITSTAAACREVAGDAAVFVDPLDVRSIAAAIERLSRDAALAADLVRRGRARAGEFSWDRCAEATLATLREVMHANRTEAP